MSSLARQTRQLERVIRRKEKIFLMEQYAGSMLQQLEPRAGEGQADEQVIDALRIAYRYVNPEMAARLSALLLAYGYSGDLDTEREAAEEAEGAEFAEEEEEAPHPQAKKGKTPGKKDGPLAEGEEDEEAGVLFERDIYSGRKQPKKPSKDPGAEGGEGVGDLFDDEDQAAGEGDAADLFADDAEAEADEQTTPGKAARKKGAKTRKGSSTGEAEDVGGLFDDDADAEDAGEGEADDLFADDADVDADEQTTPGKAARKKGAKTRKDSSTAEEGEDVGDLFADEDDADAAGEGDAADLFADEDDAEADEQTTPGKAARKKGAKTRKDSSTAEAEDVSDLFDDQEPSPEKKSAKKPRRSGEGDLGDVAGDALEEEAAETPRAKPTKGHKRKETQGFAAPESAVERDEKSRRGFALYASDEDAEQDQVTKSKSRRKARDLAAEEEEEEEEQPQARKGRREGRAPSEEEEAEERREGPAKPKREARPATAEEEKGKKQGKEAQAADPKSDEKKLNLDALTYQVTVEDLRTHMGISLVRDDHVKLIRRWDQKSRDNSIRLLLDDPKATQHPYALIPRITRFVKDGQVVQVNMLNLVRHFFQLFENVPQVIQLKSEPFFVTETPTMEWAIVACEALPDTLNKTFLEQRTVFNNYIQKYMSNDRRVRRRVLVEALYDIIVLNLVAKEPILRKTVDLTETRRGRQHQLCINFGAKGIRINSITRDQRHPQMGMCPSW